MKSGRDAALRKITRSKVAAEQHRKLAEPGTGEQAN